MFVRESKAAKAISAFVILSPTGEEVATVNVLHTASRSVVNVWQSDAAAERSAEFANANRRAPVVKHPDEIAPFPFRCAVKIAPASRDYTADDFRFTFGKASGCGYDRKTAALSGLVIDGHPITDHCSRQGAPIGPDNGRFPTGYEPPKGFRLSNWFRVDHSRDDRGRYNESALPDGWEGYADCYRDSGLGFLSAIGYRVIQAI